VCRLSPTYFNKDTHFTTLKAPDFVFRCITNLQACPGPSPGSWFFKPLRLLLTNFHAVLCPLAFQHFDPFSPDYFRRLLAKFILFYI